jgi:hypothetical protein
MRSDQSGRLGVADKLHAKWARNRKSVRDRSLRNFVRKRRWALTRELAHADTTD